VKNFHLPLPKQTYSRLKAAAERTQMPATALAREAIDLWLRLQLRKSRRQAIAAYAGQMAVPISTSTPSWSRPESSTWCAAVRVAVRRRDLPLTDAETQERAESC